MDAANTVATGPGEKDDEQNYALWAKARADPDRLISAAGQAQAGLVGYLRG